MLHGNAHTECYQKNQQQPQQKIAFVFVVNAQPHIRTNEPFGVAAKFQLIQ